MMRVSSRSSNLQLQPNNPRTNQSALCNDQMEDDQKIEVPVRSSVASLAAKFQKQTLSNEAPHKRSISLAPSNRQRIISSNSRSDSSIANRKSVVAPQKPSRNSRSFAGDEPTFKKPPVVPPKPKSLQSVASTSRASVYRNEASYSTRPSKSRISNSSGPRTSIHDRASVFGDVKAFTSSPPLPTKPQKPAFQFAVSQHLDSFPSVTTTSHHNVAVYSTDDSVVTTPTHSRSVSLDGQGISKRDRILDEINNTERTFLSDMNVLHEVYVTPCMSSDILPLLDFKLLFGNVNKVIEVSTQFLALLQAEMEGDWLIGAAFLDLVIFADADESN
jgi:RhoGEF domain